MASRLLTNRSSNGLVQENEVRLNQNQHTIQMKMTTTKTLLAVVALGLVSGGLLAPQAQAVPITGKINFTGGATLDTQNLNTATRVNSWTDTFTTAGNTGTFLGTPVNTAVTFFAPWNFNSGPIMNFWTTANGFKFDLTASAVFFRSSTFLSVTGTGIISGNGFDPTPGTWTFTVNDSASGGGGTATFSFAASTSALPEGGSALALLGISLLVVEGVRRKLAAV